MSEPTGSSQRGRDLEAQSMGIELERLNTGKRRDPDPDAQVMENDPPNDPTSPANALDFPPASGNEPNAGTHDYDERAMLFWTLIADEMER